MAMTRATAEKMLAALGWAIMHKAKGGPFRAVCGYYGTPEYERIVAETLEALVAKAGTMPRSRDWCIEWRLATSPGPAR